MRLLLMDNDANFRRALAIALRLDGILVREAPDLPSAEALLAEQSFDAAVLHLNDLGSCAGLVARVRERSPLCRIVVCNAHREVLAAARAEIRQPVLELQRPFGAQELISCLQP